MKKFVIITDSCADLAKDLRDKYDIDYVPMGFNYEENGESKEFLASLDWVDVPAKDFYNLMRNGVRIRTTQVNAEEYRTKFTEYLLKGVDILSISCSSALSASYNASLIVRDELLKKYPDRKVICIDSKNSTIGEGLLCMEASNLRKDGKSIDEVSEYIESHKLEMNQFATVDDLKYLKRSGRISATSALFGSIFLVKPIIISDVNGANVSVEKVKGRKVSISRIAELCAEQYKKKPSGKIGIAHADCIEEADALISAIKDILKDDSIEYIKGYVGPIVGASTGPGTLIAYTYGEEVTFDSKKEN